MKKFESLGKSLSKKEQKRIKGGYEQPYYCLFTYSNGTTEWKIINANNGTAAQCQADAWCWNNNNCSNADCVDSGPCA